MCNYCEENSPECCIYFDSLYNKYYLDIETSEWDYYDDGFVHLREYINYCPWCGRNLADETALSFGE